MEAKPTIAVTFGDPAGIGPEVAWKALSEDSIRKLARWILLGEGWIATELKERFGDIGSRTVRANEPWPENASVALVDRAQIQPEDYRIGHNSSVCGAAAIDYVRTATELCLSGQADAIVTGPLSKEAVALSGMHFTGHTEYLAELCGVTDSRMLFYNDKVRVVHVTTHISLLDATKVTHERITTTIRLGFEAMQRLGWADPEIAVCGLNPHAGENGMFGSEEIETIIPAIEEVRKEGINALGPFPGDALFMQATRGKYDLVVAMYHDQGCIPMKVFDFENTVNVTLGLPIIRTSVDHGTAFDIAGQGVAEPDAMKAAMRLAVRMAS